MMRANSVISSCPNYYLLIIGPVRDALLFFFLLEFMIFKCSEYCGNNVKMRKENQYLTNNPTTPNVPLGMEALTAEEMRQMANETINETTKNTTKSVCKN